MVGEPESGDLEWCLGGRRHGEPDPSRLVKHAVTQSEWFSLFRVSDDSDEWYMRQFIYMRQRASFFLDFSVLGVNPHFLDIFVSRGRMGVTVRAWYESPPWISTGSKYVSTEGRIGRRSIYGLKHTMLIMIVMKASVQEVIYWYLWAYYVRNKNIFFVVPLCCVILVYVFIY